MEKLPDDFVYQHEVVEFTQVAVQFCAVLEQCQDKTKVEVVQLLLRISPLLYIKALLLPKVESEGVFVPDEQVTEADYDFIRTNLAVLLGNDDEYLDVVSDKFMETDETEWKRVSELLADIYQPIRNFLAVYRISAGDSVIDALWQLEDSFEFYWGTCLVDALARMHRIMYALNEYDDEDIEE